MGATMSPSGAGMGLGGADGQEDDGGRELHDCFVDVMLMCKRAAVCKM